MLLTDNSEDMFRDLQIRLSVFLSMIEICHKREVTLLEGHEFAVIYPRG